MSYTMYTISQDTLQRVIDQIERDNNDLTNIERMGDVVTLYKFYYKFNCR